MPYHFHRHQDDLLLVTIHGYLEVEHAEAYIRDLWLVLDGCPPQTDILVDGRCIEGGPSRARQRVEQIVHHPNLGHVAFVIGSNHLLIFAPLVRFVSGIGLFGDEQEAFNYLLAARGQPRVNAAQMPSILRPSAQLMSSGSGDGKEQAIGEPVLIAPEKIEPPQSVPVTNTMPQDDPAPQHQPAQAPQNFGGLGSLFDGFTQGLWKAAKNIEQDRNQRNHH